MVHFIKAFIYIRTESAMVFLYFPVMLLKMQNHILYEIGTEN